MYYLVIILLLGSVIGMIIYQFVILKFFLCYEALLFIISVVVSISSCRIIGLIIVLYVLWNSTFEVILGLTVLFIQVEFIIGTTDSLAYLLVLSLLWN